MIEITGEWSPLLKEGIIGKVFVMNLSSNIHCTITRIMMMPNSKIPLHNHDKDCEWYLEEDTGESTFCPKGGSHSYCNDSEIVKFLISVKRNM